MITGGVKFFDVNAAWTVNGGSIIDALGTGSSVVANLLGKSRYVYWSTSDSNDSTTETLTLTFPSYTITRLLFVNHNWKQYTCQYWNGSAFVDFTGVLGLDPTGANWNGISLSNISETAFVDNTSYYEVNPVTTTQIQITITKTQVANAQKTANFIIVTSELYTLQGFPKINPATVSRNVVADVMLSYKQKVIKSNETYDVILDFSPYTAISPYSQDADAMYGLHDRDVPFLMWLCGGRRGTKAFKYAIRPMRLQDLYSAQLITPVIALYPDFIYVNGIDLGQLEFVESV